MGNATPSDVTPRHDAVRREAVITWVLNGTDTVGKWIEVGALTDISVHVYASGYNGATVSLLGSNEAAVVDGTVTNAKAVEDLQGNAMAFTANGLEGVGVVPRWMCPQVTAGTLNANATIVMVMRKQARG